jgi:hypothetical protein
MPRREAEPPWAPGHPARTKLTELPLAPIRAHNDLNLLDLDLIEIKMENQDRDSNPANEASSKPRQPSPTYVDSPAPVDNPALVDNSAPEDNLLPWTTLLLSTPYSYGKPCSS